MQLAPGLEVTPTIRLVRLLKQGGMGSVWVADHRALRTQVAVKFMSPELAKSAGAVTRFSREATAAAQIKSPHVVQILDHGVTREGLPFIVMELLEGEELGRRIRRTGPLGLKESAKVLVEAARALGKAHALGIVHRDIKPDNVFLVDVEGEPFVKILDFGIAKQKKDDKAPGLTTTGSMVGTPYYMSPEQLFSSKHVDLRSDVWSLGIVAYRMLTGRVPFSGETLGAICVAIEKGTYAMPSALRPGLSTALDAWFLRALAREPSLRFASTKEMAEAFVAVIAGAPEPARLSPADLALAGDPLTPLTGDPRLLDRDASTLALGAAPASSGSIGTSAQPTFGGASRTSAGGAARGRSALMLAGVFAGIVVGGLGVTYFAVRRAEGPSATASSGAPSSPVVNVASAATASASVVVEASPSSEPAPPPESAAPEPSAAPAATAKRSGAAAGKAPAKQGAVARPAAQPDRPKSRDRGF